MLQGYVLLHWAGSILSCVLRVYQKGDFPISRWLESGASWEQSQGAAPEQVPLS